MTIIDLHKDPDGVYRYKKGPSSQHIHDAYGYFRWMHEATLETVGIDFGLDADAAVWDMGNGSRIVFTHGSMCQPEEVRSSQVDWIIEDEFEKLHLDSTAISGDTSDRGEQSDGIPTRQQERQRHLPEDNQSISSS